MLIELSSDELSRVTGAGTLGDLGALGGASLCSTMGPVVQSACAVMGYAAGRMIESSSGDVSGLEVSAIVGA